MSSYVWKFGVITDEHTGEDVFITWQNHILRQKTEEMNRIHNITLQKRSQKLQQEYEKWLMQ